MQIISAFLWDDCWSLIFSQWFLLAWSTHQKLVHWPLTQAGEKAMTHPQLVHHLAPEKDKVLNAYLLCCSTVHTMSAHPSLHHFLSLQITFIFVWKYVLLYMILYFSDISWKFLLWQSNCSVLSWQSIDHKLVHSKAVVTFWWSVNAVSASFKFLEMPRTGTCWKIQAVLRILSL